MLDFIFNAFLISSIVWVYYSPLRDYLLSKWFFLGYTLLGQHLVTVEAEAGFTSIPMVEANVVIVKVGNNVQKLVIK